MNVTQYVLEIICIGSGYKDGSLKRDVCEGTLKSIWDTNEGGSIWLVIGPRINFVMIIKHTERVVVRES